MERQTVGGWPSKGVGESGEGRDIETEWRAGKVGERRGGKKRMLGEEVSGRRNRQKKKEKVREGERNRRVEESIGGGKTR